MTIGRNVDVLVDVGAIEHQRVSAGLTLDNIAAVARIPDEGVVAVAEKGDVVATSADHGVVAVTAEEHVIALASGDGVVPGAAVDRQLYGSGGKASSIDDVVASTAVDDELIVGALGAGEGDGSRQAGNCDRASHPAYLNGVVAGGAIDGHAIGRAIAHAAAGCRREVDRNLRDTGAGEVADRDVVGAAASGEVDVLDAVEIHGDVGDVAREPHPPAIGRDVDFLVDVGPVEHQRVGTRTTFNGIAAIARVPDEGVVAAAELRIVVAAAADDDVIARAPDQHIVAVAAGDGVVAVAAVEGEVDQARKPVAGSDSIVTAAGVKHKISRWCRCRGKTAPG